MTGGGNDILGSGCAGTCSELVDQVAARLLQLRQQMEEDGVEDVLIISYGYPADASLHDSLDYSRELLATNCTKTSLPRCHYIDPIEELAGKISGDGIHPTAEGYDVLGQLAWDKMQAEGMRR
jgi:lysophospholipase L1-like esterase